MTALEDGHQRSTGAWQRTGRLGRFGQQLPLITGNVVLVLEGVPAFNLLVLVLQTFIPVFQALPLSRDAELTATWKKGRRRDIISEMTPIFHRTPSVGTEPTFRAFLSTSWISNVAETTGAALPAQKTPWDAGVQRGYCI